MKLTHKLMLAMILPALLIWVVGIYAARVADRSLREAIETTAALRAQSVVDEVDRAVRNRAADWQAFVRTSQVRETLAAANRELAARDNPAGVVQDADDAWRRVPAGERSPFMQQLMSNPLAKDIIARQAALRDAAGYEVFPEVFLTNRYGGNVAQSNRTSDYRQDDEEWWQRAVANGLFIDEISRDDSAGVYSVDICVRMDDETGALAGVLKAVLNIREVFEIVDAHAPADAETRLMLFSGDRRLIREGRVEGDPLQVSGTLFDGVELDTTNRTITVEHRDAATGRRFLRAFAMTSRTRDAADLDWVVLAEYDADRVFAPIVQLRRDTHVVFLGATLIVVVLAGGLAWS
ncbi:MAG: hypothetical protein KJO43_13215, partial [Phycisphaerae bacterium]|nr:hypothetical protein [Phycisphaerae bacterium]